MKSKQEISTYALLPVLCLTMDVVESWKKKTDDGRQFQTYFLNIFYIAVISRHARKISNKTPQPLRYQSCDFFNSLLFWKDNVT